MRRYVLQKSCFIGFRALPQSVGESLAKDVRQELFSFSCATSLELGQAEALALLITRDRGSRLQYVLQAVDPYLNELRARVGGGWGGRLVGRPFVELYAATFGIVWVGDDAAWGLP